MTTRISPLSRASDQQVLSWVKRRAAGESPAAIAKSCGRDRKLVSRATNAVLADDAASGEDVSKHYWQARA